MGPPGSANGAGAEKLVFVGFSDDVVVGYDGLVSMTAVCQMSYPKSRTCTSQEYADTINYPNVISQNPAWIRGLLANDTEIRNGSAFSFTVFDQVSGAYGTNSISCNGWSSSFGQGLTVSEYGQFSPLSCELARPVACCSVAP